MPHRTLFIEMATISVCIVVCKNGKWLLCTRVFNKAKDQVQSFMCLNKNEKKKRKNSKIKVCTNIQSLLWAWFNSYNIEHVTFYMFCSNRFYIPFYSLILVQMKHMAFFLSLLHWIFFLLLFFHSSLNIFYIFIDFFLYIYIICCFFLS